MLDRKGSLNCALIVEILQNCLVLFKCKIFSLTSTLSYFDTWLEYFVFIAISFMMTTINLHWSLVLLILFTAFALLLTLIVLLKLGQGTKYDIYYSRDGLAYKIIDLWYSPAEELEFCGYIMGKYLILMC